MDQIDDPININALLARAPGNPILWHEFLGSLARRLNCDSAFMLVTDLLERENTRFLYSFNLPAEYRQLYENRLNRQDAFNHFISKNPRQVFCSNSLAPSYCDAMKLNMSADDGLNYRFGTSLPCNHRHALSLFVNREKAFNQQEQRLGIEILRHILPLLDKSIQAEKCHKINSQLFHYLGARFDAYIIIDKDLNILFADPLYHDIINGLDCINIQGKKFGMNNPLIEKRLAELILNKRQEATIPNQCLNCMITLIPIESLENLYHWECHQNAFILTFTHDQYSETAIKRLTEIYALSKCEAICALHFLKTPSISDVAASTCRSQETVRNHLKRTMQKMDVHNQASLMKKLLALSSL